MTPLGWWMASVRAALFPGGPSTFGGPGSVLASAAGPDAPGAAFIAVALAATTAIVAMLLAVAFVRSERRAKDPGLLERTSAD